MKTSNALTVSVSIFRGRISWHFSLSKKLYFSSCFRFGAHIVSTVILTNYERTHKATTRQSVWNRFYWQSKIRPPICTPFGTKSYTIRGDSGCTLAITGRNQNASRSDPVCLLGGSKVEKELKAMHLTCVLSDHKYNVQNQKMSKA